MLKYNIMGFSTEDENRTSIRNVAVSEISEDE
jgi:hypothetical protein